MFQIIQNHITREGINNQAKLYPFLHVLWTIELMWSDKIAIAISELNPDQTVGEYKVLRINSHVIKAKGFSSYDFCDAVLKTALESTPKAKRTEYLLDHKVK